MKKYIFTTEDGIAIFEGDKYFTVAVKDHKIHPLLKRIFNIKKPTLWQITGPYINPKATNPSGDIKYFHSRQRAEEYVSNNKPEILKESEMLKCPNCKHTRWVEGPGGGSFGNIVCGKCGKKYNNLGPFGLQEI